jgi:hypothetical protein
MEKEFIPYQPSLDLKELGFDEPCFWWYDFEEELRKDRIGVNSINSNFPKNSKSCSAPLFSQAFRWFREKYGYFTSPTESDDDISKKYDWLISKNLGESKMFIQFIGYRDSYEEAELECLKKLIEIVKEK